MLEFLQHSFTSSVLTAVVVFSIIYFGYLPKWEYSHVQHRESALLQVWSNDTEEEEEGIQVLSESLSGTLMENMFFKPLSSTQPRENESTSTSVAPCVPNHNFLMQTMTSKIGLRARRPTSMIFIAAFDYSNYSVITTEVIGWYGKAIYCRYLDENRQELGDAIPSTVFPESVVYCCSREGAVHMTLTEKSDDPINEVVRITDRRNDDPRYFLSFCLAPIFGKERKWLLLAELFEHYKLQGVEHFYIYIKEVDNYTKKLLDYYVTIGEIEIVTFTSKEIKDVIDTQLVGVAECLHRSRHHSRYAFFADLDERVLTTHGHTFSSFVRNTMAKASNSAALRFTSRLVFRTSPMPKVYQGEKTLKEHLPMAVFRNSSSIFAGRMTKKCVLDPKRVLIHYIHTSRAYYPGYEINDVPFKKIHIRHYRANNCDRRINDLMKSIVGSGPFVMTEYPNEHMKELFKNIKEKLELIYKG